MRDHEAAHVTYRMVRVGDENTLNGYVFTDKRHAHEWLSQGFVDRTKIVLDEVQVGPLMPCRQCGGSGFQQHVKKIRRLTEAEVFHV